ncbi:MAG: site-specific DNA-methyltransferase [Dehalococcoides mccartyi]|uniref:site-specific DNA-methyltransferase n=1 Tax=Dehalococcoides TaxID=61434 RepID=UPI002737E6D8|nr:site-specific DNA-methyltransferase [Dehalococcoides mccartyi]MDP4280177.1 site-specific DNA-methyltransferase [Dehalococcoides mccartyi]
MKKITDQDPESKSRDIVTENIEQLKVIFPEVFTEGRIDFEVLKQLLGGALDEREEKYGLNWHGKRNARLLALTPSTGTLRPCPEDSVDWDTTQNLMIEGDNLEVLKLLQKSYARKVKLIYIDPPYNTGGDFVYPDDFQDNIKNYLMRTGQIESDGRKNTSNTEASGRYHTDWLNMVYPRIKLARNLLRNDGVMFISIDDGEVARLRKVCDEIFGEENFFAQIPWQSRTSVQNDTDLSVQHEYLVAYAKSRRQEHRRLKEANADIWHKLDSFAAYPLPLDKSRYSNPDNDPRGPWKADPFDAPAVRENLTYAIVNPNTGTEHWPPEGRHWRTEETKYHELLADNRIIFGQTGNSRPLLKVFYEEKKDFGEVPTTWFDGDGYGTVTSGTQELQDLFNGVSPFTFPKPTSLICALLELCTKDEHIVLDFFAGSGTTSHAVMKQNVIDGFKRHSILVQLPEPTGREDYPTISAIAKERIRRAGKKLREGNPLFTGDVGFRVFKLDSSNIRAWEPDRDNLAATLEEHAEHLKVDRTEQDILFELLLKLGLDLTIPIEEKPIAGKTVFSIGAGTLLVCLATEISEDEVEPLALGIVEWHTQLAPAGETQVVFRDSAFANDVAKTNLTAILEQHGLENVRSI